MTNSESIKELAAALCKAQGQMTGAKKDSENPFYKSHYADLSSVWEACRKPLADNGLAVIQTISNDGQAVCVTTMLTHSSGEWVSDKVSVMPAKADAQQFGAVSTYLRRYALSAIIGGYAEDLDAEPDRQAHADLPKEAKKTITKPQEKIAVKLLTMKDLEEKIKSSVNVFELEARAKKYRMDFDALTADEQAYIKDIKTVRKGELEAAHIKDLEEAI